MKCKKNAKLVFKRFNGDRETGSYLTTNLRRNGAWLQVKVDRLDKPLGIRPNQVISVDGIRVG